jgi:nucleoid-associated protein YgaU
MGRQLSRVAAFALVIISSLSADAMPGASAVRLPVRVGPAPSTSVVVVPGDHLWKISATHLASDLGRNATDAEIWPYWREVIVSNAPALRSGDPDLIYPGEVIELPPR